jgi:hypothetical protein
MAHDNTKGGQERHQQYQYPADQQKVLAEVANPTVKFAEYLDE